MGILKSKCCVCGLVYGEKETSGSGGVSHGLCSSRCGNAPIRTLLFSDPSYNGIMNMDRAYVVGKRLYWNMKQVMSYSQMDKVTGTLLAYAWNAIKGTYTMWATSEGLTSDQALKDEAFRLAKDADIPLLLTE